MTDPLTDAMANAQPEPPKPATVSMRIDKCKDGGFIVGDPAVGGTFASESLSHCLNYIDRALRSEVSAETPQDEIIRKLNAKSGL